MTDTGLDELFNGPLETFVKRRDALAAERKKAGDKTGAAAVKALAKPAVSAHGVNRLWVSHRPDFETLLAAGEALRDAVRQGGGDALRDAQKRQRALVTELRDRTSALLVAEGHATNAGTLERITRTLGAISTRGSFTPYAPGRLSTDLEPPGLDELIDVVALSTETRAASPKPPVDAPPPAPIAPPSAPDPTERERRAEAERAARTAMLIVLADAARVADDERDRRRATLARAVAAEEAAARDVNDAMERLDAAQKALASAKAVVEHETQETSVTEAQSAEARARLDAARSGT